jgi:preprotein translocase subunit SecG
VSTIVTIIHVVICLVLIIAVLLQSGKAADLAGAFGGVGSQTAFGPRGTATILSKVTTIGAVLFMITSMSLWVLSGRGVRSAVSGEKAVPVKTENVPPAKTGQTPPAGQPTQTAPAAAEKDKKQPEAKPPDAAQQKTSGQETKKK